MVPVLVSSMRSARIGPPSLKYLYYDFDDTKVAVNVIPGTSGVATGYDSKFDNDGHLLRAGNEVFHYALYDASHHAFLIDQCRQLHRRLKPYRRLQLRVRHRMATSLAEHQAITDAVLAFDGDRASQLARDHIVVQGARFSDLVASLSTLSAAE